MLIAYQTKIYDENPNIQNVRPSNEKGHTNYDNFFIHLKGKDG